MKKFVFGAMLSTVLCTYAQADGGLYVGVGAGYGTIGSNTTGGTSYPNGSSSQGGGNMAGSVYVGYDFSHYVGIQADYDYIANVQYSTGSIPNSGVNGDFSVNQQVLDLGITGHLPFSLFADALSGISVFGRLAFGYSTTTFSGGQLASSSSTGGSVNIPSSASNLVPVVAAGAEYGIGQVGIRLEYQYIGNSTININGQNVLNVNNNLVLLSALYHF